MPVSSSCSPAVCSPISSRSKATCDCAWRDKKLFRGSAPNGTGRHRYDAIPEFDQVTAIPEACCAAAARSNIQSLPFQIVVRNFFQNSRLQMLSEPGSGAAPDREPGPGAQVAVKPVPRATGVDDRNVVERRGRDCADRFASGAAANRSAPGSSPMRSVRRKLLLARAEHGGSECGRRVITSRTA